MSNLCLPLIESHMCWLSSEMRLTGLSQTHCSKLEKHPVGGLRRYFVPYMSLHERRGVEMVHNKEMMRFCHVSPTATRAVLIDFYPLWWWMYEINFREARDTKPRGVLASIYSFAFRGYSGVTRLTMMRSGRVTRGCCKLLESDWSNIFPNVITVGVW